MLPIDPAFPVKLGKWRIIPEDVAERSWENERQKRKKDENGNSEGALDLEKHRRGSRLDV